MQTAKFDPPAKPDGKTLGEIMTALGTIEDRRQPGKIKYRSEMLFCS